MYLSVGVHQRDLKHLQQLCRCRQKAQMHQLRDWSLLRCCSRPLAVTMQKLEECCPPSGWLLQSQSPALVGCRQKGLRCQLQLAQPLVGCCQKDLRCQPQLAQPLVGCCQKDLRRRPQLAPLVMQMPWCTHLPHQTTPKHHWASKPAALEHHCQVGLNRCWVVLLFFHQKGLKRRSFLKLEHDDQRRPKQHLAGTMEDCHRITPK
mmetsp:Transcript_80009/g.158494  ORF Transcript_80009/g.158494 Transcript_80009/m.158494 type:complete len:205 (-) Transcript_80009:534-1148(-)